MLSRYVVKSHADGHPILFDTTQKVSLPADADEATLRSHLFLRGQEEAALEAALFGRRPSCLVLNIMPTWRCNLRCTHCCVLQRLVKTETLTLDADKLLAFAKAHRDCYGTNHFFLRFAGGEPLLAVEKLAEITAGFKGFAAEAGVLVEFSLTTNLAMDLDERTMEVLADFEIAVSIDGMEESHNAQRKSPERINPFRSTVFNLKKIMLRGWRDRIMVQGAVTDERFADLVPFYRMLLKLGVHKDHIKLACIHPTELNPEPSETFLQIFRKHTLFPKPCCKYQYMTNFTVDNRNKVYTDFYIFQEIGNLDDPMSSLEDRSRSSILSEMPALADPKCRDCPVIGYCWGGCSQGNIVWEGNPSKYCDQELLINKVSELAKSGIMEKQ